MINNLCSSCRANTSGCTFRRLFAGGLCCAQCDHDDHFANMPEAVSATNIRAQAGRTRRAAALLVHHAEDDEAFRAVLDDVAATEARLMIKAMVNLVEELSPAIFSERGLELLRRVIVERAQLEHGGRAM